MLLKIKNHGNSFCSATGGYIPAGAEATILDWELKILVDCGMKVEVIEEVKQENPFPMVSEPVAEESVAEEEIEEKPVKSKKKKK